MTTKTEELLARLPEIEEWNTNWVGKMTTEGDLLALCAAVRELAAENERLKRAVGDKDNVLAEKNRRLDMLHWVWCNGGCETGFHRYDGEGIADLTPELVATAEAYVERLKVALKNKRRHG